LRIEAGGYLVRTLTVKDASERWGEWLADPEVAYLLNAEPRRLTRSEVVDYIRSFDQHSRLLLGIFDQQAGKHIGIITVAIDHAASRGLGNMLIGEPDYRNQGVLNSLRRSLAELLFDTLGLQTMVASVLAHNQVVLDWMRKHGWILEHTLKGHIRSRRGDQMLDVCLLRYPREAWEARKRELAKEAES
jgi:RimJ/RimL family protein N-acetyltransferase